MKSATEPTIADLIYDARIEAGITQTELADLIGSHQPVISRLEAGVYNPSVTTLRRIAEALELELEIRFVQPGWM